METSILRQPLKPGFGNSVDDILADANEDRAAAADEIDRLQRIIDLVNRGSRMAMPPDLVEALGALSDSEQGNNRDA